ncbi:MAG: hypothetical protein HOG34_01355 [Bacteroidetes bacterium]|nr:hypothetical protein [Bacteroidota bacterium]
MEDNSKDCSKTEQYFIVFSTVMYVRCRDAEGKWGGGVSQEVIDGQNTGTERRCNSCGAKVSLEAFFCSNCGSPVACKAGPNSQLLIKSGLVQL